MANGGWTVFDTWRTVRDPMPLHARFLQHRAGGCAAAGPDALTCSRPAGHTGRHLAVMLDQATFGPDRYRVPGSIVAVWP